MLKCKYADEYKAMRAPKCDGGRGCEACRQRWDGKQRAKARQAARMLTKEAQRLGMYD